MCGYTREVSEQHVSTTEDVIVMKFDIGNYGPQ